MVRILDVLTQKKNPYANAHGVNYEGFPTFRRSWQEGYLQILLTNSLGGTFYAQSKDLLNDALGLHQQAVQTDPDFMARALVYARSEGLMRLQPIIGLAILSKVRHDLFHAIFGRVILTPGDLSDFVEILRGGVVPGGMGRSAKRAINAWLNRMSEYHAIKYATGGQGYSLRDILRVSHPKPTSDLQDALFLWLTDKEKWSVAQKQALTPQISAFESLKKLAGVGDQGELRHLIANGKLPYEVVTGVIQPDATTWAALMRQMPYLALLRHLNTLQRAGVLADPASAEYVAGRLSKVEAIQKAKILPFQFFSAYQMFKPTTPDEQGVKDALAEAMETSFVNLPNMGRRVCIAPDTSGSMTGRINDHSQTSFIEIAGIFSAALLKKSANAIVLPFDTQVHQADLSRHESIMSMVQKIRKYGGGGTAVSAPISHLLAHKTRVDTFIGITDNVEWATDQYGGVGFLPTWQEYKKRIAPQAKAFLVTIAPYRMAVAPQETPDVHYIYGWSDSVLKFISITLAGLGGQVEAIQASEL
jgi:60 kDa SS-A/Ro ribonucleoprotein